MKNLLTIALILFPSTLFAEHLFLDQVSQSTCKITIQNRDVFGRTVYGYGTGTVISEDDDSYFILTNGHIITDHKQALVEFFYNGYKSASANSTVVWSRFQEGSTIDAALLSVKKSVFGKIHPKVIPLADKNIQLKDGDYIYSSGCPNGRWAQAWEGRVIKTSENITYINSPPVEGQSGSAILADIKDDKGNTNTRVVGLLSWRFGRQSTYGGGVSLSRLYEIMTGVPKKDVITASYSYLVPAQHTQDDVCDICRKLFSEHLVFPDGNGGFYRSKNGDIRISCPTEKLITSGIRTREIVGTCPTCPPGGCPLLPWNGGKPHERYISPNEPAPITPDGIWNVPESEQAVPFRERISQETKEKLQELEEAKKLLDSLKGEKETLTSEKKSLKEMIADKEKELLGFGDIISEKEKAIESYISRVSDMAREKESIEAEKEKLELDNTYENVSFTAAGIAGTAGVWFLKSYLLPSALSLLKRPRNRQKLTQPQPQTGYNNSVPEVNYGTVPDAVLNSPQDRSQDVSVEDKSPRYMQEPIPQPKYADEINSDRTQQLPAWNNYPNYPNSPHPVQYYQHMTGYNPGAPFGVPKRNASGEIIRGILSEIVNEYGHDNTMTPGHIEQLLNQRLETRYGIK